MAIKIPNWFYKKYPQNILIKNPLIGTLIFLAFSICFTIIYKPLQVHESRFFSFETTIIIYFIIVAFPLFGIIKLLKHIRYFSNTADWTILKELLSILFSLLGVGITIYFAGFIMENPEGRLNLSTFFNSLIIGSLIGIIPLGFFTIINYRYLLVTDVNNVFSAEADSLNQENSEAMIRISSRLKKEELEFYPNQFIYAESDGNYTVFYIDVEDQVRKRVIRNSISNIENQLLPFPFFFRTHRAFIINIKRVISQKGNTMGYRLKLTLTDTEIPVSRQKTRDFDQIMRKYH